MVYKFILHPSMYQNPTFNQSDKIILFDINSMSKNINTISQIPTDNNIEIYDYTYHPNHVHHDIIKVSDHINKTGYNPLIGNQSKLNKPFVDLSNLYSCTNGVVTSCIGKYFNNHKTKDLYPSTYLCYISIIARAYNHKLIKAFLINNLNDIKND
tara:strand:- start:1999 stop:2463 length:465 start_codon:yes stop_codon:yes gene_type:complete